MYSKLTELTGFGLIALGIAALTRPAAALVFGGVALLFIGGTTDDAAVALHARRIWGWMRYVWHRQVLREQLGQEQYRSPHPPIRIDPETEAWASRAAASRRRTATVGGDESGR